MALGWRNQYSRYKDFFLNVYGAYQKKTEAKMFIEILLSVSISAIFVFFALRPTVLTILELVKTIQEKESTIKTLEQKIENINLARKIYDENSPAIALVTSAIPEIPEPEMLSRQVQGLAAQNSVELSSLAIENIPLSGAEEIKTDKDLTNLPSGANPITFSLNIKSSNFPLISNILSQLENLRVPIKLDSFTITSAVTEETVNLILAVGGRSPYLSKEGQTK